MRIDIRIRSLPDAPDLVRHAERQLRFHLSRFGEAIGSVVLRIADVNGPRGGVDKRCQITARLKQGGSVTFSVAAGDALGAVNHAAERAARIIARELARSRTWQTAS